MLSPHGPCLGCTLWIFRVLFYPSPCMCMEFFVQWAVTILDSLHLFAIVAFPQSWRGDNCTVPMALFIAYV